MTPREVDLLISTAHAIAALMVMREAGTLFTDKVTGRLMNGCDIANLLIDKADAVRAKPSTLTPRPKYVRIEKAPADTRFNCQSCGDDGDWLVRIGEYYDPSALLCPTCIREAAALLDTST